MNDDATAQPEPVTLEQIAERLDSVEAALLALVDLLSVVVGQPQGLEAHFQRLKDRAAARATRRALGRS